MNGHGALLKLRLSGKKPSDVFIIVLDAEPEKTGYMAASEGVAEIEICPGDIPHLLDLRAIRSCRVHVCGTDEKRVRAVAKQARTYEPSEILAAGFGNAILRWRPKA